MTFLNLKVHDSKNKLHKVQSLAKFPWEKPSTLHIPKEKVFTPAQTQLLDKLKKIPLAKAKQN